jgi:hypothetical protein
VPIENRPSDQVLHLFNDPKNARAKTSHLADLKRVSRGSSASV